jgi:hypothetical protein
MLNAVFGGHHLARNFFMIYILCNTSLFLKYGHYDDKSISIEIPVATLKNFGCVHRYGPKFECNGSTDDVDWDDIVGAENRDGNIYKLPGSRTYDSQNVLFPKYARTLIVIHDSKI